VQQTKSAPRQNRLLAALPAKDRGRLIERSEQVDLVLADVLYEPGAPVRRVLFPTSGFISLLAAGGGHDRLEVGLVGDEGMLGTALVLGAGTAPMLALVQGAGAAWQMDARSFQREVDRSGALRVALHGYIHVVMCQLAQAALCTRFHLVEARLARWLLMTHDRAHSRSFHVTHEFLAVMLGVRRAGVTGAARALHARELIRYSRGDMTIVDRRGLENAACGCYAIDRKTYATTMN
jgi:CRP-like cAMP-binding protein